jgi:hypothetical protein
MAEGRRGSSGRELALRRIRDSSPNGMAVCKSVQILNDMESEEQGRASRPATAPGLVVVIQGAMPKQSVAPVTTIEHEPLRVQRGEAYASVREASGKRRTAASRRIASRSRPAGPRSRGGGAGVGAKTRARSSLVTRARNCRRNCPALDFIFWPGFWGIMYLTSTAATTRP